MKITENVSLFSSRRMRTNIHLRYVPPFVKVVWLVEPQIGQCLLLAVVAGSRVAVRSAIMVLLRKFKLNVSVYCWSRVVPV